MGARATQLAKISRPQTYHALPRERLFARIDKARTHPVIWVSAPPGAGKTTMVVSYLETHGVGGLWYQVDRDDSDPATFCYFLGLAERRIRSRKRPLPLLTPEYLSDLAHYSRRLFRELFSRISLGQVLVLDNFQEVPDDSPFHELIEAGIQEVPDGINLIVISRVDPPQRYSRLVANQRIALLDWEAMKLTLEETQGIAALATRRDSGALSGVERGAVIRMHEQSGGWCAGLVLLLEHARPGELIHGRIETDALHGIFDYFASQLFDRITAAQCAKLPVIRMLPDCWTRSIAAISSRTAARTCYRRLHDAP
jgi:LuxR family maltose regulon positive regulatory protein